MYEEHYEDIGHLFLHCRVISQFWCMFLAIFGMSWTMPRSIFEQMQCWKIEWLSKKLWMTRYTIPQAVWWTVWFERNSRIFLRQQKEHKLPWTHIPTIFLLAFWCSLVIVHDADAILDTIEDLLNLELRLVVLT